MSSNEERDARRIKLAEELFKAWSSGDADAPEKFFTPTGTLYDVVAGKLHDGWPEIREFFAGGLMPGRNLTLIPERYWVSDDGVALTWIMSMTITDDSMGPEIKGKRTRVMGMTELNYDEDDLVTKEVDYWTADDIPRSLGLKK